MDVGICEPLVEGIEATRLYLREYGHEIIQLIREGKYKQILAFILFISFLKTYKGHPTAKK